eukprot:gnl/TRDRNA2_/TRDRNA2_64244_c0_seq1.p1 gnl/TRDRNA2_/TRDRNA2_64244_c0~~gnl/TRDRNA2_/TRDRNA2_64244_c0_seq1.p1  ORF type:complete len:419 (-),score=70.54 gnl/TRDRNA2_/TRDRNA2_64244_c0_seq1:51-1217(-)
MVGDKLSLADFTWFPTTLFMNFMLPRVFGWPRVFNDDPEHLPNLAAWWKKMAGMPEFAKVQAEIDGYWHQKWEEGQFETIIEETKDPSFQWRYPVDWEGTQSAVLHYQEPPPKGKRTGRYIDRPDGGELEDEYVACVADMHNGRKLSPPATLITHGFALIDSPTALDEATFRDDDAVVRTYYEEMRDLVKKASGASRVHIFDHTIRESSNTNLNAKAGESAAPVPRVHCDYTHDGAPRRLAQLGREGIYSHIRGRVMYPSEVAELASKRFAFINIWRSIDDSGPVMQMPLAVCDEASVPEEDRFLYELHFPDRVGENYSLKFSEKHKWYMYPKMTKDECLVFKVYDKNESGKEPRFVFHTAYADPRGGFAAPPRKSIEVRAIAFFDEV